MSYECHVVEAGMKSVIDHILQKSFTRIGSRSEKLFLNTK